MDKTKYVVPRKRVKMSKNIFSCSFQDRQRPDQWMYAWGNITRLGGTEKRMIEAAALLPKYDISVSSLVRSVQTDTVFQQELGAVVDTVVREPHWRDYWKSMAQFEGSVVWTFGLKQSLIARLIKLTHNVPWIVVMPSTTVAFIFGVHGGLIGLAP